MSETLDYKQAAHSLRVSVAFVKWCTRYSVKSDGKKLVEMLQGRFEQSAVEEFDAHMWADWKNKNVPDEVTRELRREACGMCGLCGDTTDRLDEAHIDRLGIERDQHCQHPHNLILLCKGCHDRYDWKHSEIDNATVKHAKERLMSRHMEAIDRDIALARGIREVVDELRENVSTIAAQQVLQLVQSTTAAFGFSVPNPAPTPEQTLSMVSGSLGPTAPLSAAQVEAYSTELETGEDEGELAEWTHMDVEPPEGLCARQCGNLALVDEFVCLDCDHMDYTGEEPAAMEEDEDGRIVLHFHTHDDQTERLRCAHCDSDKIEFSFEAFCSYCKAAVEKLEHL